MMTRSNELSPARILRSALALAAIAALSACGGEAGVVDSEELSGADESAAVSSTDSELSTAVQVGTVLGATTAVNLRSGPSTSYKVLTVVPNGGHVTTVERTTPSNGFYKVSRNGIVGWTYGAYYNVVSRPASTGGGTSGGGSSSSSARDNAIARAKQGVGFSYWWGHGRWRPEGPTASTRGSCSGSCPSCSHGGSYGSDCSGFVAKVWQVPSSNSNVTVDSHPYSTFNFDNERHGWHSVTRSAVKKADAMVYNSGGAGHIFLYESGDGWGSMWTYECKGCSYGCVHNLRTASSAYKAIGHDGF